MNKSDILNIESKFDKTTIKIYIEGQSKFRFDQA